MKREKKGPVDGRLPEKSRWKAGQIVEADGLAEQLLVEDEREGQVDDGEVVNGQSAQ